MATAGDLVDAALKEIGVLAASETATAGDAADGLTRLNRLIDRLANDNLTVYTVTRTTWTITANDGQYTVGTGADVNIARPIWINEVRFIDTSTDPDTEYPLERLTEDGRAAITLKALTATFPQAWYYNPTLPNGTLDFWPVPTSATLQGVIYAKTAMTTFAALTTTVTLPPGYEEMLYTNLALLLCPSYERQPNPVLIQTARESLAAIKRANKRPTDMSFELGALVGNRAGYSYDIRRE